MSKQTLFCFWRGFKREMVFWKSGENVSVQFFFHLFFAFAPSSQFPECCLSLQVPHTFSSQVSPNKTFVERQQWPAQTHPLGWLRRTASAGKYSTPEACSDGKNKNTEYSVSPEPSQTCFDYRNLKSVLFFMYICTRSLYVLDPMWKYKRANRLLTIIF